MKHILCFFGKHRWKYYSKRLTLQIPNPIRRDFIDVPLRECKQCGNLQHHLMPKFGGKQYNWKNGEKFRNSKNFKIIKVGMNTQYKNK